MFEYEKIGLRLKKLRIYFDLTQEQVASILDVSHDAILKIENGQSEIDILELSKFSKLYSVSIDELLEVDSKIYNKIFCSSAYDKLSENDKLEIFKLIEYKKIVKKFV